MQIMNSLFKCPVCSKALHQGDKQYYCKNGHSFDIARKGYVNLLLPKERGSGDPGDKKEMLISRREFLSKGYYEAFSDCLNDIVVNELSIFNSSFESDKKKEVRILDAGCGEGYYTRRLKDTLSALAYSDIIEIYGIDISKSAVHYASGGDKGIRYAVASTYHTPIISDSMDFILCIFAPRDEAEFRRILKKSGKLIVAAPGPRHLLGLKKTLYEDSDTIGQKGTVGEGFHMIRQQNVTCNLHLDNNEDIINLWRMTPYSRHTDEAAYDQLKKLDQLSTEIDINIMVYQKE